MREYINILLECLILGFILDSIAFDSFFLKAFISLLDKLWKIISELLILPIQLLKALFRRSRK